MMKRNCLILLLMACVAVSAWAQDASPVVKFYSTTEEADVEMSPGESQTTQAPLDIACTANVSPGSYNYICEWRIYNSDEGEDSPLLTRFDDDIQYTLTRSGGYGIKLYVTFFNAVNDTVEYESEPFNVVISESKLICPDGFSPNGDGINDRLRIEMESIVKLNGAIFNRWGQKLFTFTLQNAAEGWDGMQGGKAVKDGVYMINIDAMGSDGIHYKIKKAINVLKGFIDTQETTI